jgi:hypothetical protein
MSGAFNQPIFNSREKPMTDLLNRGVGSSSTREVLRTLARFRAANYTTGAGSNSALGAASSYGCYGDSFLPYLADTFKVGVTAGIGYYNDPTTVTNAVDGVGGLVDSSSYKPIVLDANVEFSVPTADPTNPRIDIIEMRVSRLRTDLAGRAVLDTLTGEFLPESLATTLDWSVDWSVDTTTAGTSTAALSYRRGTAGVSPTPPTPTAGYIVVGYVYVAAAAVTIAATDIYDWRPLDLGYNGLDVAVTVTYVGGATGGLSGYRVTAPPGVRVEVTDDAVNAGFTVDVFAGDPSRYVLMPVGALVSGSSANLMVCEAVASFAPVQLSWWSVACLSRIATAGVVSYAVSAGTTATVLLKLVQQGSV